MTAAILRTGAMIRLRTLLLGNKFMLSMELEEYL